MRLYSTKFIFHRCASSADRTRISLSVCDGRWLVGLRIHVLIKFVLVYPHSIAKVAVCCPVMFFLLGTTVRWSAACRMREFASL